MTDAELAALIALGERIQLPERRVKHPDNWDELTQPAKLLPLFRELQVARTIVAAVNDLAEGGSRAVDALDAALAAYDKVTGA